MVTFLEYSLVLWFFNFCVIPFCLFCLFSNFFAFLISYKIAFLPQSRMTFYLLTFWPFFTFFHLFLPCGKAKKYFAILLMMCMNYDGDGEHHQTPGRTGGLEMHLHLEPQVSSFFSFFIFALLTSFYYFTIRPQTTTVTTNTHHHQQRQHQHQYQ